MSHHLLITGDDVRAVDSAHRAATKLGMNPTARASSNGCASFVVSDVPKSDMLKFVKWMHDEAPFVDAAFVVFDIDDIGHVEVYPVFSKGIEKAIKNTGN